MQIWKIAVVLFFFWLTACSSVEQAKLPANPEPGDVFIRPADGMEMVFIPAGSFLMGLDPEVKIIAEGIYKFDYSKPEHEVSLSALWMDKTSVTNAQFAEFLTEKGNQEEAGSPWLIVDDKNVKIEQVGDKFQPEIGFENHPVIRVSWYGAAAYCDWAGARLPTEAEREYAERGPQGNKYPWGNEEPSYKGSDDNDYLDGIEPVGSYPTGASWVGILDLEGNTFEWVNDWFDPEYYAVSPADNPQGPETAEQKVVRGASWGESNLAFTSYLRQAIEPNYDGGMRFKVIGFRCAISHPE